MFAKLRGTLLAFDSSAISRCLMARKDVFTRSALVAAACLLAGPIAVAGQTPETGRNGRQVYESICITCHGPDGRGGVNPAIEQIIKTPDFSDCGFASREPDRG